MTIVVGHGHEHEPASANWEPLGETFYRKQDVYTMQWNMNDLSDFVMTVAPNGGPIALVRDDRKPVLLTSNNNFMSKPKISVYSAAGVLMQTIQWESTSRIVKLGWTTNEDLVVLTQDGHYRIYSWSSTTPTYTQHSLGHEAQEAGVSDAHMYEGGMVVMLDNLSFIQVANWDTVPGGKIISLANPNLVQHPTCWCVLLSPDSNESTNNIEVLVSTNDALWRIDEIECTNQRINRGPFTKIAPSPNGRLLGLVSQPSSPQSSPQLWVTSSDFDRSLSELDLGNGLGQDSKNDEPNQIVWCGNNTLVVAWDRLVIMMGPFGESLKYFYAEPVVLVGEIDGTRIIGNDSHELLQMVPQSSQDVFRPGSASSAAILFEASELFESRSPRADEFIRNIKKDLVMAVDTCIQAAGQEFDVFWQKRLLKAAAFGKTFLDMYNPSSFVEMSLTLRVLNAVRSFEIGIPITYDEYQTRSPTHLISRLTNRDQHLLALRISNFLKLSTSNVLKHWAFSKILKTNSTLTNTVSEDSICQEIVSKLKLNQQERKDLIQDDIVSCSDVAETAWLNGKVSLATQLLQHETKPSKQIPLLLKMKQQDSALTKSIESGDPNLIYSVLIELRKTHALGDFFRFVDRKPDAVALLKVYAKENDLELLRDFYYQDDRWKETACLELEQSLTTNDFGERVAKVRSAAKLFNDDKDCTFEFKMTEEYIKLLIIQQNLEQETPGKVYVGSSVNETIRQCIVNGNLKKADKIKNDFKVPDKRHVHSNLSPPFDKRQQVKKKQKKKQCKLTKRPFSFHRFWYIKLKALVSIRDWESLELFARSKKSPIGYEPWVDHLVSTGHHRQAVNFIARCEPKNRVELYVKTGEWNLAGQECVRKGERTKLIELKSRAPNSMIAAQLDSLISDMDNANV
ncbi:Vacuolar protein sorting-associated protein 16 [Microbotryomycetes sp. JL221]|nr:Vacuolar protein sorting-associated protein 16 [Microbotryomycetes sp. JL221]